MKTGYIYRIWCLVPGVNDEYVGSTTDMRTRKCGHKSDCNNENHKSYNFRVYSFIRENGGWNNWRMSIIEQMEFEHRWELTRREGEVIQSRNATLNSQIAGRTVTEYHIAYRQVHRNEIKKKQKEWRQAHNEERKEWRQAHNEEIKEYRQTHKEELKEKAKEYYRMNKEKLDERRNEKFNCVCGGKYIRKSKARHFKSDKHIKNYEQGLYEYINS